MLLILNVGKENNNMYSTLTLVKKYVHYYLNASNGKGHGVHSPFVYQFIQEVLLEKTHLEKTHLEKSKVDKINTIESLRKSLLQDKTLIEVWDRGAGSRQIDKKFRPVHKIAATSLKPKKYAQLIAKLVEYFQPVNVIEMGTSLGITTAYIASATNAAVISMEGAPTIAAIAKSNLEKLGITHVEIVEGNFDNTLSSVLTKLEKVGMAYVDGNHKYIPTMQYFHDLLAKSNEDSVFIFDDIHWSEEMEKAWAQIKVHPSVTVTVDLFFIGLVFFRKENKEPSHFVIRY
jgi:predicted O-methyltransferase YrrM